METAIYREVPQSPLTHDSLATRNDDETQPLTTMPVHSAQSDSMVRLIFFMLGSAVLLPWNALITATPYFLSRLDQTSLKGAFGSYLSISFTAANFIFLAHATFKAPKDSSSWRIFFAMTWITIHVFTLTLSTYLLLPPLTFFSFLILNGISQAAAGSYLQTDVVAIASLFGHQAIQSMMSGMAAVGVVVSAIQLVSASAFVFSGNGPSDEAISETEAQSAFVFFGASTVFMVGTIVAYSWFTKQPIYADVVLRPSIRIPDSPDDALDEEDGLMVSEIPIVADEKNKILRVIKANFTYEVAGALNFVVTLAVFPAITASIQPTNPAAHPLIFSALHFLLFNLGDFSGRALCTYPSLHIWQARQLLSLSCIRSLFIPVFLLCNIQRYTTQNPLALIDQPPFINSDFMYLLILTLFGLTNGYLSSMCMMAAPSLQHNRRLGGRSDWVEIAATLESFALVGGLAVGSAASFVVRSIICHCNPFVL